MIFGLITLIGSRAIGAESPLERFFGFDEIWEGVKKSAPSLKALQSEVEAAQINQHRTLRHFYPRVWTGGRVFSTNDPGASFMYTLQQRQISTTDFAPVSLNQPGNHIFEQLTLGVDLSLYEGGMRVAEAKVAAKGVEAKSWEEQAQRLAEYARAAQGYAALLVLNLQRQQLQSLSNHVSGVLENYGLGSKSNPVGYSGLLGLKNLRNRIEGLLVENEAKIAAKRNAIRAIATDLPDDWQPKMQKPKEFLMNAFFEGSPPAAVLAARSGAEAMDFAKEVEKAKFLPKVSVFAQGDLYGGSRSAATSYTAGMHLQWELFSASNCGAVHQAELQAVAAHARADDLQRKWTTDHAIALSGTQASEKNLNLLEESASLLEEQTRTARSLFRNGSINALQLVEVLNRRADLLVNWAEAGLNYAQMKSALFLTSAKEGMPHEFTK